MHGPRILCLPSHVLGNKVFSGNIARALSGIPGAHLDIIPFSPDTYRAHPAPRLLRRSNMLEATWAISRSLQNLRMADYQLIVLGCYEQLLPLCRAIHTQPVVLFHDTTPALARRLVLQAHSTTKERLKTAIALPMYSLLYGWLFRKLACCFPMSQWCANSLMQDFGVRQDRIEPVYNSLDLTVWKPADPIEPVAARTEAFTPLQLLFIGNDFHRKGGRVLLDVLDRLRPAPVVLTIISSDPAVEKLSLPDNVRHLKNIPHHEIVTHFQRADLFVFPTFHEQLPNVLTEALACGVPVIARNVGGIPDIIRDGHNGRLLPWDSSPAEWAAAILPFIADRNTLASFSRHARETALTMFDQQRFDQTIRERITRILNHA
ncbi:glycosyltransferase family 4 protein [Megalodesulfovibrio paquesii]